MRISLTRRLGFTCSPYPTPLPPFGHRIPSWPVIHRSRTKSASRSIGVGCITSFNSTPSRHLTTFSMSSDPTASPESYRLPNNVRPTHYELTVRTDLEKLVFDGFVRVQ